MFNFFLVEIGHRSAIVHFAQPRGDSRCVEHCGSKLRLPGVGMAQQRNIADFLTVVDFHERLLKVSGITSHSIQALEQRRILTQLFSGVQRAWRGTGFARPSARLV